ncbi:MAG: PilC/PilY family type IV pilus protein, partial [Steroidobacteraceae bacterium]
SATSMLTAAGGDTTAIKLAIARTQDNDTDEWARFMQEKHADNVYAIEVNKKTTGQGPGWSELLRNMADSNGGSYQSVSAIGDQIAAAIKGAFAEIQATNSVFASVSLPLSASTQGTYLNQVYVGLFRPDGTALPRWDGNLKQYKLGHDSTGALRLQDAIGNSAVDATSGFVKVCSKSYWTTANTYWNFRSQQFEDQAGCAVDDATKPPKGSDYPDGKFVEKGGQAQQLRNTKDADRKLTTCTAFDCPALKSFDKSNVTESMLGASSSTEHEALVNWARGQDVDNEHSGDGVDPTGGGATSLAMRPSAHGDVVHSRPVAINFGTSGAPKVVVFYGGNDGVFRAVNGNRPGSGSIEGVEAGGELWGFVPPEFHSQFKRLRENTVQVSFPNVLTGSPLPKPYAIDGAISAYRDSSHAWIYAAMRRGGRSLYAFDVNVAHPNDISLKWKVGCTDTTCTSNDVVGIGQTWSSPKPLKAKGYVSGSAPLLMMGGGYDACEDASPNTCSSSSKGHKVYVLDAEDGTVKKSFDTERGVIADVTVVPDLTTGLALYAYVVDLGGNVYRVDIKDDAPANWSMTKIASLGCAAANTSCVNNRKFMFAPDVLLNDGTYVLLIGSGDREKPREYAKVVDDYFFMLKDRPDDAQWLTSEAGNCTSSIMCLSSLHAITDAQTPTTAELAAKKGWYLTLNDNEKVVTSAITIFGTVTFSTHEPRQATPGMCTADLGLARVYNISYLNASSQNGTSERSQELPPDIGLPPSPVAGLVTLDDGTTVPFCIGCSPDSPLEGVEPTPPASSVPVQPKSRVYWYIER